MTPQIAAMRIAPDLLASETELDQLLGRLGGLVGKMTEARIAMQTPAADAQRSIGRVLDAMAKIGEARGDLGVAHKDLMKNFCEMQGTPIRADVPVDCPAGCFPLASAEATAA